MDERLNSLASKIILWAGVGIPKSIRPIIRHFGSEIIAVFVNDADLPPPFVDIPMYFGWDRFLEWIEGQDKYDMGFCLSLSMQGRVRLDLHDRLTRLDLKPTTIAHPAAVVEGSAIVESGTQIMAASYIGPEVKIGKQCIINARVGIDHECNIGDVSEIAPGATLCGCVTLGENAYIGAGATVLPGITIGPDAVVGAGSLVNKNVPEKTTVIGVPAKPMK